MRSNKIEAKKQKSGDLPHIFHSSYLSHTNPYICFLPEADLHSTQTITHFFLSLLFDVHKKTNLPRRKRPNTFHVSFVLTRSFLSSSFFSCAVFISIRLFCFLCFLYDYGGLVYNWKIKWMKCFRRLFGYFLLRFFSLTFRSLDADVIFHVLFGVCFKTCISSSSRCWSGIFFFRRF